MVFSGSYEHSLDDKGRIIMPQEFRRGLGDDFVVTKGPGNCLFVFPKEYWENKFESKLEDLEMLDVDAQLLLRFFCAEALIGVNPDSQGRIPISSSLREYAGIKMGSPIMILGILRRIEIWDKAAWITVRDAMTAADINRSAIAVGLGRTPIAGTAGAA